MNEFTGLWIPQEIMSIKELGQTEKMLLAAILALSQKQCCYAGNQYFSELLGISKHRVSVVINGLKNKGFLELSIDYESDSKKIEKRRLKILMNKFSESETCESPMFGKECDSCPKTDIPYVQKRTFPMSEKVKDIINNNNKIYNISSSQLSEIEKNQKIEKPKVDDKTIKSNKKFDADSKPYKLAEYLEDCIRINEPKFLKGEQQRQRWAKDIDRMLRIDKIVPDEVAAVILWSQKDSFWRSNILSGKKLREKYPQLLMKMNQTRRQCY